MVRIGMLCLGWVPVRLIPAPTLAVWRYRSWQFMSPISNGVLLNASGCVAPIVLLCLAAFHPFTKSCSVKVSPMTILCVKSCSYWCFWMHSMYSIAAVCQHYIALHYIHNAHGEYHLVYLCVGMRAPGRRWNPGGWMQRRWGGNSSRWFIMSNNGAPKLVRHDSTCKSWRLYPVCPQFIAKFKVNPTPASKLAS